MIVNQSVIREKDLDFVSAHSYREPKQIAVCVISALLGMILLLAAALYLLSLIKLRSGRITDAVRLIFYCVLAYWVLSRSVFLRHFAKRNAMKDKEVFAPRTYTVDADGITASHSFEGVDRSTKFSFANAECFFAGADTLYLCVRGENNTQYFIHLHDDSYTEGSREELLSLLREKGVQQQ